MGLHEVYINTGYKNPYLWKLFYTRFQVYKRAKSILEQNNVYKQNSFNAKSNTVNTVSQVIKTVSSAEKGYDPSCVAYTKNQDVNGFKLIKAGCNCIFHFDHASWKSEDD